MRCQIISIGNELLIGDTINTNASWMGQFLTEHSIDVVKIHTVGDDAELIKSTIGNALEQSDLVITTGGLGPTHDDVTKKAVADIFGVEMTVHKPTLQFIQEVFQRRGLSFSESNYAQAEIPSNAEVLFNKQGTAPGLWFEEKGAGLAVLPGVPFEMKQLLKEQVLPKINARTGQNKLRLSRYLVTAGVGESNLSDEIIGPLDDFLTDNLSVAYLPNPQGTKIRISASGEKEDKLSAQIEKAARHIYQKASEVIIGEGRDFSLAESVGNQLRSRNMTIAVAESCTGGMLSDTITNVPGCSDYMMGGVVAYANEAKVSLLEVSPQLLDSVGAVSKEVAMQMAKGAAARFKTDIGISTTGIAGPSGGTEEKPVGTVWVGYWSKDRHFALKALFTNDRLINKERSVAVALEMVRRSLNNIETMPYGLNPHFT